MVFTQPSKTMASPHLTDSQLIQTFVEGFVQGQPVLLSNANLRTEPLFDSMQLIDHREGVVSTAQMQQVPIAAKVCTESVYWPILHDALSQQNFYPLAKAETKSFYNYQYCLLSPDYEMHCTTAKELWRICWGRGQSIRSGIPLDLMIWGQGPAIEKESWHPLRGMDCDQGLLMMKILGGFIPVESQDLVVWARKIPERRFTSAREEGQLRAGMRGYLRLRN